MPQYGYNDIIVVINIIMLEFLSARFVNLGTCYHFIFFDLS